MATLYENETQMSLWKLVSKIYPILIKSITTCSILEPPIDILGNQFSLQQRSVFRTHFRINRSSFDDLCALLTNLSKDDTN